MRWTAGAAAMLVALVWLQPAAAQVSSEDGAVHENATVRGRDAFQRGVDLSTDEKWADALAAFREAASARDHPRVEYNIAYCERALGHYAAAIAAWRLALRHPEALEADEVALAKEYLALSERTVVRLAVTLEPATASLSIDGLPLGANEELAGAYYVLVDQPGPSAPLNRSAFSLVLDPGVHVFHASRPGREDVDLERSFVPGARDVLDLRLDLLPASVSIRSEPGQSFVSLDEREVGLSPIEIQRPAGTYRVQVFHDHFETYGATLFLQPGQRVTLTAKLNPERDTLTRKWWFWTGVTAVVAGGALLTYAVTRPAAQPPPYEAGSANWLVHAQGFAW